MYWFIKALKQFADFKGRARRKEYWMFRLLSLLIYIIIIIFGNYTNFNGVFLTLIFFIIIEIPNLSIAVRRLHDINRSGWLLLLTLIPLIGDIWVFGLLIQDGDIGNNNYGEDPKSEDLQIEI